MFELPAAFTMSSPRFVITVARRLSCPPATVPTLVLHGEDDQIVSIAASAHKAIDLLANGTLKTYPGLSHGMLTVNADRLNADMLEFITG